MKLIADKEKKITFHAAYAKFIVGSEKRNTLIVDIAENLILANKSTLLLVKQIPHGEVLQQMLLLRGYDVPFAQGANDCNPELIDGFNNQDFPLLIGTSVLSEGVDTRPCEYVINAGGGKAKNTFMQLLGRGFRRHGDKESCKIIMFKDTTNKWFEDHFNACCEILADEYGIIPTKL